MIPPDRCHTMFEEFSPQASTLTRCDSPNIGSAETVSVPRLIVCPGCAIFVV